MTARTLYLLKNYKGKKDKGTKICIALLRENLILRRSAQVSTTRFLSRVSILLLTRDIDIVILSVRPSVCP